MIKEITGIDIKCYLKNHLQNNNLFIYTSVSENSLKSYKLDKLLDLNICNNNNRNIQIRFIILKNLNPLIKILNNLIIILIINRIKRYGSAFNSNNCS
jgi:hypothetical protein